MRTSLTARPINPVCAAEGISPATVVFALHPPNALAATDID
jgi:hypothetical protein